MKKLKNVQLVHSWESIAVVLFITQAHFILNIWDMQDAGSTKEQDFLHMAHLNVSEKESENFTDLTFAALCLSDTCLWSPSKQQIYTNLLCLWMP